MDWLKLSAFLILFIFPLGHLILTWLIPISDRKVAASFALGLFIVSIEVYILGLLNLYFLATPVMFIQGILSWYPLLTKNTSGLNKFYKIPVLVWIIISVSVYINCLLLIPFGQITKSGISLYGAHFVDSTWHLSLINSLNKKVPPENPIYSGTRLLNYHYLVDLQISMIHKATGISVPKLYFGMIGPLYLLLLALLIYRFTYSLTKSVFAGISSVFLMLLGSNFYYFFGSNPSIAWVDFFSTKTVNFPLLFSLIILIIFSEIINFKLTPVKSITFGILSGAFFLVKSHSALVWLASLGVYSIYLFSKKIYSLLLASIVGIIVLFIIYFGMVTSGDVLTLSPFWFIKTMYEGPDRLHAIWWELSRQTLISSRSYFGLLKLYGQGIVTFILINFGLFWLGLFSNKLPKIMVIMFFVSLTIPMFYIQRGAAWNSIQFIYPIFIPLVIGFSVLITGIFSQHRFWGISLLVLVLVAVFPGNKYITDQYIQNIGRFNISPMMVNQIDFIKNLPGNTIMVDESLMSGSYLQAYTGKSLYLGDKQMLESLSIDSQIRHENVKSILNCQQISDKIDYVLTISGNFSLDLCYKRLKNFENYTFYQMKI